MAKKVYMISSINGWIGNDQNFPQPWTIVDCENVDISADSNSIKIAGSDEEVVINHDINSKIIGMQGDAYFTNKGDFFSIEKYPAVIVNGKHPLELWEATKIKLPDLIPERTGGPDVGGDGRHNQSAELNDTISGYVRYAGFTILATQKFLHVISWGMDGTSIITPAPQANDYFPVENTGRKYQPWEGLTHIEGALGTQRQFPTITSWFQFEFAFKDFTVGSITVAVSYKATKYARKKDTQSQKFEWKESEWSYRKQIVITANDPDKHDIHKICCLWENIKNVKVSLVPQNDFKGTLCYNAISSAPLYERSFNLQGFGGIAYNVAKIPPRRIHPMFMMAPTLRVGCWDVVKTFILSASEEYPETALLLAPWNDIKLGVGSEIIGISQYWSGIVIYVNRGNDAYQLFSAGLDGNVENSVVWKDTQFISVSNNGFQDFVVAKTGGKYALYLVSGGNKKLLYQSIAMLPNLINGELGVNYLFNFGGESFSREDRVIIWSKEKYLYLYENTQGNYKLTKFPLWGKGVLTFANLWDDVIPYFINDTEKKSNLLRKIKLGKDWNMHQDVESYFVIPPLFANYGEGTLEEIQFWSYLPNEKSKIELWAKADEKNFITLYVKGQKGKDLSKIKINREIEAELIDNGLDEEGNGYLSYRLLGDIKKVKDVYYHLLIYKPQGGLLIRTSDLLSYDHFIKIEEITRATQQYGNKTLGYNHAVHIKKINNRLWSFAKLHLKFILKTEKWTYESPKVYAPIYLIYRTKDA